VNTLGIPQAHPARKEKGTYIIHALCGGVEVTLLFAEKGNTLMVFPKEGK
jgi:phenylalanyl-tRNA synthetase alpha subunit